MMLEVRNLRFRYGATAAVRASRSVKEIVALLGANGAGKSTVARAIAGMLPFPGDVSYKGQLLVPDYAE
jgi:branched-chain amino acid transport system ATP-binding protein